MICERLQKWNNSSCREDRQMCRVTSKMVRELEKELQTELRPQKKQKDVGHAVPALPANVEEVNN